MDAFNRLPFCGLLSLTVACLSFAVICGCARQHEESPQGSDTVPVSESPPSQAGEGPERKTAESRPNSPAMAGPPSADESRTGPPAPATDQAADEGHNVPEGPQPRPQENHTRKSSQATTAKEQAPWPIPEGPLDDEKYIEISAQYAAAVQSLPEEKSTSDVIHLVLQKILKDADVTEAEYNAYTDKIARQPQRKHRIADAIEKRLQQRSGWSWSGQPGKKMKLEQ